MRRRVRIDLGQQPPSDREQERLQRKRDRWQHVNRNKSDQVDNPFIKAISPTVENYGCPDETQDLLLERLRNFEFGNFPGYANYRNKAAPQGKIESGVARNKTKGDDNLKESIQCEGKTSTIEADSLPLKSGATEDLESVQIDSTTTTTTTIEDERLTHFKPEWFRGKTVLDIGCNRGSITYAIAKLFEPRLIIGVDIDSKMIAMANRDLHLHLEDGLIQKRRDSRLKLIELMPVANDLNIDSEGRPTSNKTNNEDDKNLGNEANSKLKPDDVKVDLNDHDDHQKLRHKIAELIGSQNSEFPIASFIDQGPIVKSVVPTRSNTGDNTSNDMTADQLGQFPNNLIFIEHNYVPASEELVAKQGQHFDTIVCLSVTKWIHLNYRDEGIKRFFKRVYNHLHQGGLFILEAQPFDNYGRRKRTSDRLKVNFYSIQFKPEQFDEFLLSPEVGFKSIIYESQTNHECAGFQRPIKVFLK